MGTAIIANPVMGWIGDHWSHRKLMAGVLPLSARTDCLGSNPGDWFASFSSRRHCKRHSLDDQHRYDPRFQPEAEHPSYIGLQNTDSSSDYLSAAPGRLAGQRLPASIASALAEYLLHNLFLCQNRSSPRMTKLLEKS
jgi:hypothetical protein